MFFIKKNEKTIFKLPVDLTLQQTINHINAPVASQRTGIREITNSTSAGQRLTESHYITLSILHLSEELNLTKKNMCREI